MAMSELKQRLFKIELTRLGFPDAQYSEANNIFKLSPSDSRLPKISNNGDIHYGIEYEHLVEYQIQPLVKRINEIVDAWEKAPVVPVENISHFRVLAEYNSVMLAARDDSNKGFDYGFEFVTWRYDRDRLSLEHGNYTTDFEAAKEDYAVRCGLINRNKMFNETELKLIHQGLVHLGVDYPHLTTEQMTNIGMTIEKIEMLVPAIRDRDALESHELLPKDGIEL